MLLTLLLDKNETTDNKPTNTHTWLASGKRGMLNCIAGINCTTVSKMDIDSQVLSIFKTIVMTQTLPFWHNVRVTVIGLSQL